MDNLLDSLYTEGVENGPGRGIVSQGVHMTRDELESHIVALMGEIVADCLPPEAMPLYDRTPGSGTASLVPVTHHDNDSSHVHVHLQPGTPDIEAIESFERVVRNMLDEPLIRLPYRCDSDGQIIEWGLVALV